MESEIYKYKAKNMDILPQLLEFSKSLIKPANTIQIQKYTRSTQESVSDITQLLNKLCKTNIANISKKIGEPNPNIIAEILNYNVNYVFEDKLSFGKAECVAELLLAFNNKNVNTYVLNHLQAEFSDLDNFIKNRLILVREYFAAGILSEKIYLVIIRAIINNKSVLAVIILLQNLRKKNIIDVLKPDLLKLIEIPNIKLKDKFILLSIIEM